MRGSSGSGDIDLRRTEQVRSPLIETRLTDTLDPPLNLKAL